MSLEENHIDDNALKQKEEEQLIELMRTCRAVAAKFGCFDADSIAEGYLTLARIYPKYDYKSTASLKTFLIAALRNTYIKYIRDKKKSLPLIYIEGDKLACISFLEDNKYYEVSLFIVELLEAINSDARRILTDFYVKQIPIEMIAEELGLSVSQTYKKLQKAIEEIRCMALQEMSQERKS